MKKLLLILSLLLFGIGLAILVCDLVTFRRYRVHINEFVMITEEGYIIDWPTGEAPWWAQTSIRTFVLLCWISAAGTYFLRYCIRTRYQGRICRGAE